MSASQSNNTKQICENILIEGKRYNIEQGILCSENAVADQLLARGIELTEGSGQGTPQKSGIARLLSGRRCH